MALQDLRPPAVERDGQPRLRVLHVITHLDMGGAEGVAMELIDRLRHDIDLALFAVLRDRSLSAVGQDMADRLERWNVPVRFGTGGRFKSGGVLLAAHRLMRELKRFRPDVVHLHTEIPELTFAVAVTVWRMARRVPLLRSVHNSTLWIGWHRIGVWVTGRLAHGEAIAVSRCAADADAAILTRRARPRAVVIYNGVGRAAPHDARRSGTFRLLFAGRLVHQKGADLLPAILTAAHGHTMRRDVEVTIAGSGVLRDTIQRELAGMVEGWTVRFVPPIGGLSAQLAAYDAVLLPSRFEGFALLPLEVLLAGVPLITTLAPGLDEAIPPDYPLATALEDVGALGEKVAQVMDGEKDFRAIALAYGDALAQRFDPTVMAQAYHARYCALASAEPATAQSDISA